MAGCAEELDVVDESDEEIKNNFSVLKEINFRKYFAEYPSLRVYKW